MNSKILIIDDDPALVNSVKESLELIGFTVLTALNGREGLQILKSQRPGLIILDLVMPVMNGWQFLDARTAIPELKNIPILICSEYQDSDIPAVAADFLRKPFGLEALISMVKMHCQPRI